MPVIPLTLVTTMPVQSSANVVVGSLDNPEPLIDLQRPLKRRLDLAAEIAIPIQPLDGASCAMPTSTVAAAVDTTP